MLILKSPRHGQPPGIVTPARGVGGALVWTAAARNVVRSQSVISTSTEGSSLGLTNTALGRAASWGAVANAGVDFGLIQPLAFSAASGITIAVVAAPTSSTQRKTAISFRNGSGSYEQTDLVFNSDGSLNALSGYATLYVRNTAGSGAPVTASAGGLDGGLHCWVFGNSSASGYIYRDGVSLSLSTSTRPSGTLVSSSQKFRIGNMADYTADGTYVHNDPLLLVIAWPTLLPPQVAAAWSARLARDVGGAFAPRTIFLPQAAAGGGVTGTSSQTITLAGSATATLALAGASAQTVSLSGSSTAALAIAATSGQTVTLTGTSTGTVGASSITGTSDQTITLAGSATASLAIAGTSAQSVSVTGAAAGALSIAVTSAQTINLTGVSTGTTTGAVTGASDQKITMGGSASATLAILGASSQQIILTGATTAALSITGASSGTITMTGISWSGGVVVSPVAERTLRIAAEARTLAIVAENRTRTIAAENRTLRIERP